MMNQCAINNASVVNIYYPPSNLMFGSGSTVGSPLGNHNGGRRNRGDGGPAGDGRPAGNGRPAGGAASRRDDTPPPRPGQGALFLSYLMFKLNLVCE